MHRPPHSECRGAEQGPGRGLESGQTENSGWDGWGGPLRAGSGLELRLVKRSCHTKPGAELSPGPRTAGPGRAAGSGSRAGVEARIRMHPALFFLVDHMA